MGLINTIVILFILFFSIIIHEYCHGYAAYLNGDDTAKIMGRLTLNPIPHIDPIGTIILPLILILGRSPIILGMAKPVPINPLNFRNYEKGMVTVGIAGPLSNIALGTVFALLYRAFSLSGNPGVFILYGGYINFILAFFNLIPIPPLDGSRIVAVFLPFDIRMRYERMERYGIFIVIILLMLGFLRWLFPLSQMVVNIIAGV